MGITRKLGADNHSIRLVNEMKPFRKPTTKGPAKPNDETVPETPDPEPPRASWLKRLLPSKYPRLHRDCPGYGDVLELADHLVLDLLVTRDGVVRDGGTIYAKNVWLRKHGPFPWDLDESADLGPVQEW